MPALVAYRCRYICIATSGYDADDDDDEDDNATMMIPSSSALIIKGKLSGLYVSKPRYDHEACHGGGLRIKAKKKKQNFDGSGFF